jgi:hypothetical protein
MVALTIITIVLALRNGLYFLSKKENKVSILTTIFDTLDAKFPKILNILYLWRDIWFWPKFKLINNISLIVLILTVIYKFVYIYIPHQLVQNTFTFCLIFIVIICNLIYKMILNITFSLDLYLKKNKFNDSLKNRYYPGSNIPTENVQLFFRYGQVALWITTVATVGASANAIFGDSVELKKMKLGYENELLKEKNRLEELYIQNKQQAEILDRELLHKERMQKLANDLEAKRFRAQLKYPPKLN